jgi:hypothetical protein
MGKALLESHTTRREIKKKWQETGFSARVCARAINMVYEKTASNAQIQKNGSAAIKEKLKTIKKRKGKITTQVSAAAVAGGARGD